MLTPGKVIPFYTPQDGLQTTSRVACRLWPTQSPKSPSRPICLSSEATHG